jgi:IS1 family transposase
MSELSVWNAYNRFLGQVIAFRLGRARRNVKLPYMSCRGPAKLTLRMGGEHAQSLRSHTQLAW